MSEQQFYRVYNNCDYNIGVRLLNGQDRLINNKNFQMLGVDDILYIENASKYFSAKKLVVLDSTNKEVALDKLNIFEDTTVAKHMTDDQIVSMLKSTAKKIETWLSNIDDVAELSQIVKVAKTMDLPSSKIKILTDKIPGVDFSE